MRLEPLFLVMCSESDCYVTFAVLQCHTGHNLINFAKCGEYSLLLVWTTGRSALLFSITTRKVTHTGKRSPQFVSQKGYCCCQHCFSFLNSRFHLFPDDHSLSWKCELPFLSFQVESNMHVKFKYFQGPFGSWRSIIHCLGSVNSQGSPKDPHNSSQQRGVFKHFLFIFFREGLLIMVSHGNPICWLKRPLLLSTLHLLYLLSLLLLLHF